VTLSESDIKWIAGLKERTRPNFTRWYLALITDAGWAVFMEVDAESAAVGVHKRPGLGVEGVAYCDIKERAATLDDALEAIARRIEVL
jgi:hypothetical protein